MLVITCKVYHKLFVSFSERERSSLALRERDTQRERQTDKETDRQRKREIWRELERDLCTGIRANACYLLWMPPTNLPARERVSSTLDVNVVDQKSTSWQNPGNSGKLAKVNGAARWS
jgi:hypothetical protein